MPLKIAFNLVGISHLIHNNRWPISRSYLDCCENTLQLRDMLTRYRDIEGNPADIDIHLTTYMSSESAQIVATYNPKSHQFLQFEGSHQVDTFIASLESLKKYTYDLVVVSRFDSLFDIGELSELCIFKYAFNFLCKEKDHWDNYRFVNDCFYIFPFSMLDDVIAAARELRANPPRPGLMDMHGLYTPLVKRIGEDNVRFMTADDYLSSGNVFYKLIRR